MWVNRLVWESLNARLTSAEAVKTTQEHHNRALEVSCDWLRVRLTQLEHERAQLIYQLLGIKVPVPEIVPAPPSRITSESILNSVPSFEDIGDAMAIKLGISHNPDGTLRYSPPAQ